MQMRFSAGGQDGRHGLPDAGNAVGVEIVLGRVGETEGAEARHPGGVMGHGRLLERQVQKFF